jgi:hypothetical protein
MSDGEMPAEARNEPMVKPAFYPWRDAYGKEHPDIPRCCGNARRRGFVKGYYHQCDRRGVVQRGAFCGREGWYCLQHDPAKKEERRVEELAPVLLKLLREAVEFVPRTKKASDWHRRAEAIVARASSGEGGRP